MLLTLLAGCGSEDPAIEETEATTTESKATEAEKTEPEETEPEETESEETEPQETEEVTEPKETQAQVPAEPVSGTLPEALTATLVNTVEDKYLYKTCDTGIVYYDRSENMGIMTPDGKSDTGVKYTTCSPEEHYFVVTTTDRDSITPDDPASLNCFGLVDATGKELLPEKYASLKEINERYIYVAEVTEATDSKDEALMYYSSSFFSITPDKEDPLFKGVWYVFDIFAGDFVNGVTGTDYPSIMDYGDFIVYYNDDGDRIQADPEGKELPEGATPLGNDCYELDDAVYNSKHEKVFDVDPNGHSPYSMSGEYYLASNYHTNTYVLMDYNGNVVSAEYSDYPTVHGSLVVSDDKVYNFKGEQVIDGSYDYVYLEEQYGAVWLLEDNDVYTMIDKDGNVLWQSTEEEDIYVSNTKFCIQKTIDGDDFYYSFAQKDYTLAGYDCAPWLIKETTPEYRYNLVDTLSGQTLLEGYRDYNHVAVPGVCYYVYAESSDGFEIYAIG